LQVSLRTSANKPILAQKIPKQDLFFAAIKLTRYYDGPSPGADGAPPPQIRGFSSREGGGEYNNPIGVSTMTQASTITRVQCEESRETARARGNGSEADSDRSRTSTGAGPSQRTSGDREIYRADSRSETPIYGHHRWG
jgi:hypothetical protein